MSVCVCVRGCVRASACACACMCVWLCVCGDLNRKTNKKPVNKEKNNRKIKKEACTRHIKPSFQLIFLLYSFIPKHTIYSRLARSCSRVTRSCSCAACSSSRPLSLFLLPVASHPLTPTETVHFFVLLLQLLFNSGNHKRNAKCHILDAHFGYCLAQSIVSTLLWVRSYLFALFASNACSLADGRLKLPKIDNKKLQQKFVLNNFYGFWVIKIRRV